MAIEVTPPMVARLLMHVRERLMQEIDHLKATLPEDMERHTQKVFVGRTPTNLLQMVAERTKAENWQEKPTGDPLILDGLKALIDEISGYLDALPHE